MKLTDIRNLLPRNGTQDTGHGNDITHIIVHHDAQFRSDNYDSLVRYRNQAQGHINRGEDGLQYHYKIDNVGEVFHCRSHPDTLWHCGNYGVNRKSIAICLDGNFQDQNPTREQFIALKELLDVLSTQHPEFQADQDDVYYHNEVALPGGATACCGNNLKSWVSGYRNNRGSVGIPNVVYNNGTMFPDGQEAPAVIQPVQVIEENLYRVYDFGGVQVGAYKILENAKKKLDTLEAGVIKDKDYKAVLTKTKPQPVEVPFKGDEKIPETPVQPTETPKSEESVEKQTTEMASKPRESVEVVEIPEKSKTPVVDIAKQFLGGLWNFLTYISKIFEVFKKGGDK